MRTCRALVLGTLILGVLGGAQPVAAELTAAEATARVVARIPLPQGHDELTAGLGSVWVMTEAGQNTPRAEFSIVRRVDPATNRVVGTFRTGTFSSGILAAAGSVWVSAPFENLVYRFTPDGRLLRQIRVGLQPEAMAYGFGSVWVADHHGRSVSRIDAGSSRVVATVDVGGDFRRGPQDLVVGGGSVYVGMATDGNKAVLRIDPATNRVDRRMPLPDDAGPCGDLAVVGDRVWVGDACGQALYGLDRSSGRLVRTVDYAPGAGPSLAIVDGTLYVAGPRQWDPFAQTGTRTAIDARDPGTGRLLHRYQVGGTAYLMVHAAGDFWLLSDSLLRRVRIG